MKLIHIIGEPRRTRSMALMLGLSPQMRTIEFASIDELVAAQRSSPDCIVAFLLDIRWGAKLVAKCSGPVQTIVFAAPRVTDEIRSFLKQVRFPHVLGSRKMARRTANRVMRHLSLAPQTQMTPEPETDLRLIVGDEEIPAVVDDASRTAVLITVERKDLVLESNAVLRVSFPDGQSFACEVRQVNTHSRGDATDLLLEIGRDEKDAREWEALLRRWADRSRQTDAEALRRPLPPDLRIRVRVSPIFGKERYYYHLQEAGTSGVLLATKGEFPALPVDTRVSCLASTRIGPVSWEGVVANDAAIVSEEDKRKKLVVSFLAYTAEHQRRLHRLLRRLQAESRTEDDEDLGELLTAEEFAQRHMIRLADVIRAMRRFRIGHVIDGLRVFHEADMLETLTSHIARIKELRQRLVHNYVLAVDDDEMNVDLIKRILRKNYTVFTATSGEEALAIFKREPIELVITDQRMPGMTGTELLRQTMAINPNVIRIILSAYSDAEALTQAINEAKAHHFLYKPITREDLLAHVKAGFAALQAHKRLQSIMLAETEVTWS